MTSTEFVLWLKGFSEACNQTSPTPLEWSRIKEQLANVEKQPTFPITGTTATTTWYPTGTNISYTNAKQQLND